MLQCERQMLPSLQLMGNSNLTLPPAAIFMALLNCLQQYPRPYYTWHKIHIAIVMFVGRGGSVGIATSYGLED
jgi:hypothetical protein